ncbi:unnamed protein product [Danaus chrysippus]|uniref:(African queen) hypothetical protein n=1 Tax=Danaus chrysippus TaxID=151541 RepID=A0A8J2QXZ7_9NEOP|nr:unnamed protein product [Danaus chrysippus]
MYFVIYALAVIFTKTVALESTEDDSDNNIYNSFAPSTTNFQDLYRSTFNRNEESTRGEDEFTLNGIQTVEFHPKVLKISRITPAPKLLLNASYLKKKDEVTVAMSTEEPAPIKVIPIWKKQKGVLDVLFPPTRVKSFKNVFDSIRRILSYTFRK